MRCTKCHYLSFEPESRCRNCGHDLSIDEAVGMDLPLDGPETDAADAIDLGDLPLRSMTERETTAPPPAPATASGRVAPSGTASVRPLRRSSAATAVALSPEDFMPSTAELPLFVQDISEDQEPLVQVPAKPRAPVSVRRSTPDPARMRAKYAPPARETRKEHVPDLLDEAESAVNLAPITGVPAWISEPTPERLPAAWQEPVEGGTRLMAALIDAGLLGTVAAAITWCTLRFSGLAVADVGILPVWPMMGFFSLISAGYLLMFTAVNGQTLGKMALGIRVVGTSSEAVINDRVTVSQAAVRAVSALPSVLALGLGFVPALMGAGLAVHDRIAHTRVVRL